MRRTYAVLEALSRVDWGQPVEEPTWSQDDPRDVEYVSAWLVGERRLWRATHPGSRPPF